MRLDAEKKGGALKGGCESTSRLNFARRRCGSLWPLAEQISVAMGQCSWRGYRSGEEAVLVRERLSKESEYQ
ncbi:hypothetical protein PAJ34TS1_03160 [Paenibacillus azoreducens]|uniref:Uncharacterized protein n=1 Tax=Paenibacillus azoreducens TaxID=116718 RepID=A0A920CRR4_9BACL|nr:hypothetical protein J34TS1_32850 [Paenibacillus azoreducens]